MSKICPAAETDMYEPYDPFNSALTSIRVNSGYIVQNHQNTSAHTAESEEQYLTSSSSLSNSQIFDINQHNVKKSQNSQQDVHNNQTNTSHVKTNTDQHAEPKREWWEPVIPLALPVVEASKQVGNPELEIRLGNIGRNGDFMSGVTKEWFLHHIQKMESVQDVWTSVSSWTQMEEYIFNDGIRVRRVPQGLSVFLRKASIKHYDIPLKGSQYDLRLMLKSESPAQLKCGKPLWVRFKERKSFTYKHTFVYDFTKVWEGETIKQAQTASPKYEIEIECLNNSLDNEYITKSLLLKCSDLLEPPPYAKTPQLRTQRFHNNDYQNYGRFNRGHNGRNYNRNNGRHPYHDTYNNKQQQVYDRPYTNQSYSSHHSNNRSYNNHSNNHSHNNRSYNHHSHNHPPVNNQQIVEDIQVFGKFGMDDFVQVLGNEIKNTKTQAQKRPKSRKSEDLIADATAIPSHQSEVQIQKQAQQPWIPILQNAAVQTIQVQNTMQTVAVQTSQPVTPIQPITTTPIQNIAVHSNVPRASINRNILANMGRLQIPSK